MKNKFLTSYGRVLLFVYEKSVFVNNEYLIPLTQTEICKETGINKTTINNLFIEYREDNFIYAKKRRCRKINYTGCQRQNKYSKLKTKAL